MVVVFALLVGVGWSSGSSARDAESPGMRSYFALNGITPFHHHVARVHAGKESPDAALVESLRAHLALARDLGATSIRTDFWWAIIEPQKGRFDYTVPDLVVDEILAAGLEPFPILAYRSSWSPQVSPATPEEREAFGQYAYNVIERYKGKVKYWEVWNEPNITPYWIPAPSAEDYAALLEVAYRRAKEANPDCVVVGVCAAGPDYTFIEKVLRNGAARHLDVVSYHHYDGARDEAVLENEILAIRRLMERYGAGAKPLWITEMGVSTVKCEHMDAFSPEDQAAWVMKKHLASRAVGLQRLYYFDLVDWSDDVEQYGHYGLHFHDRARKPAAEAYAAATRLLDGFAFVGRAHGAELDPTRRDDAQLLLFRRGDEWIACGWVRRDGAPLEAVLPSGAAVECKNMELKTIDELDPDADGRVVLPLEAAPRWFVGFGPRVAEALPVRFEPESAYLVPGQTRTVTAIFENVPPRTMRSIPLAPLSHELDGGGTLEIRPTADRLRLESGRTVRVPVEIFLSADATPFAPFAIRWPEHLAHVPPVRVVFETPFSVEATGRASTAGPIAGTVFQNRMDAVASGTTAWGLEPGGVVLGPVPFANLNPGAMARAETPFAPPLGESVLTARVATHDGLSESGGIRVWVQPLLDTAPTVDGDLADWAAIPAIRIAPPQSQLVPPRTVRALDPARFSAEVRIAWTATALCLAAEVVDATPAINPHTDGDIWKSDCLELFIGFDGPALQNSYGEGHYHLGVSTGMGGVDPKTWNWNARAADGGRGTPIPGAEVVVKPMASGAGYILEAVLPVAGMIDRIEAGQVFGFDLNLVNADAPDAEPKEAVLIWNGTGQNWRDPSNWGMAVVVAGD